MASDHNDIETKLKDLPDKYLIIIAQLLAGHINDSDKFDVFNKPILKPSIKNIYWLFIIQYAILSILGIVSNVGIIGYVMYYKFYKDVTHAFIVNLSVCHFIQCAIVLPITLMVMLIQNWIFGQFLCFFLPLLQDIPLHVAMITHLLIAWDRMRWLGDPLKGRLPAFVCCCATWLTGMVIALPYPIYTVYLELGDYVPRLNGVGLCLVNLVDDIHEYMRGLFVIMYCGPIVLLAYLYIRTSRELRPPDGPFAVMMFEHRADIRSRQRNSSTSSTGDHPPAGRTSSSKSYDLYNAELDVNREKRTQRHLGTMAATQVICVCPLMVLRLARMVLIETYENSMHFDLTYLMFVWIAFLPTVIFPCIYVSEMLPRSEKERLRGYLRLSFRRNTKNRKSKINNSSSSRQESTESQDNDDNFQITNNNNNGNNIIEIKDNIKNEVCRKITAASKMKGSKSGGGGVGRGGNRKMLIESRGKKLNNMIASSGFGGGGGVGDGTNNNNHNIHPFVMKRLSGSINNSCSNITSSTYCNNGTSEQDSIDLECNSVISIDNNNLLLHQHHQQQQQHPHHLKNDKINLPFKRNDSSSTFDCDMEIIDLLDKERGIDTTTALANKITQKQKIDNKDDDNLNDNFDNGSDNNFLHNNKRGSERRKLPDLGKVLQNQTPVEYETNIDYDGTTGSESIISIPYNQYRKRMNRKSLHNSSINSGGGRYNNKGRCNNYKKTNDEIMGVGCDADIAAGIFGNDRDYSFSKLSMLDSKMKRSHRSSISSSSICGGGFGGGGISGGGGRSSIKSRDLTSSPNTELDLRENIFADL